MLRRYSIIWQILIPLVAVSTTVVAIASWLNYQALANANRTAVLRELTVAARRRAEVNNQIFLQAERNLGQCRDLLQKRLARAAPVPAFARRDDGTFRIIPSPGAAPLGAFLARNALTDQRARHSLSTTIGVLDELGASWCDHLPAIAIGVPASWLATWGTTYADLSSTMLPDDPVLLTSELALLNQVGSAVRWSGTYFEPGTATWCVTALVPLEYDGQRLAVYHPVPVQELLTRVDEGMPVGSITAIIDRHGQAIACTGSLPPVEGPGQAQVTLPSRFAAAIGSAQHIDTGVLAAVNEDGWIAVSRILGPDWAVITHLPPELVIGPARRAAEQSLLVGIFAISGLALAIALILRWRVAMPLRGLQQEVARLALGGKPPRLRRIRHDEVGRLIAAMDHMACEVSTSQADLRMAMDALSQRERLYRTLFAAAADAVLVLRDGEVIDANERACRLFGAEARRLLGVNPAHLAPVTQPDGVLSSLRLAELMNQPPKFPASWRARHDEGKEIETELSVGRVPQPEGDLIVLALRDVTERNHLDQQLRQVQKMETVGQLAGGIAHDFNNVLTGIVGSAELLGRRVAADGRAALLVERILQASGRATAMIQKLMAFTRKRAQRSTPLDVHAVIRETCALLERSVPTTIRIEQSLIAAKSIIIGDAVPLQTSLLNLGINARDAMPEGGKLIFSTRICALDAAAGKAFAPSLPAGSYLEIRVADSGSGMSPDTLRHLFEPFFTTKPIGKGTGLGLPAVLRAVHDHHGAIEVQSDLERGTTFRLLLPLSDAPLEPELSEGQPLRGSGRVLIVDDDDLARGTAVEMLQSLGYDTVEAHNGREGVAVYVPGSFAAVLIDMEMPILRGTECLRELRDRDPQVRAILCSGFNRAGGSTDLGSEGFGGFLQKPYRLYDLSVVVAQVGGKIPS